MTNRVDRANLALILGEDKVLRLESGQDVEIEPSEWERFLQMARESKDYGPLFLPVLAGKMLWRGVKLTRIDDWS